MANAVHHEVQKLSRKLRIASGDSDSGYGSCLSSPTSSFNKTTNYVTPVSPVSPISSSGFERICPRRGDFVNVSSDLQQPHHRNYITRFSDEFWKWETNKLKEKVVLIYEEDAKLGWKVRSTADIATNQVILTETPVVIFPSRPASPGFLICINCGVQLQWKLDSADTRSKSEACIHCNWPACNHGCGFGSHNLHTTLECSLLRQSKLHWIGNPVLYQYLWILRIATIKLRDPLQFKELLKLSTLTGEDPDRIYLSVVAEQALLVKLPVLKEILTQSELCQICKILICKLRPQHLIGSSERKLRGLYLRTSMLGHSCLPNVDHWIDENFTQTLVATRPIKAGDYLSISYEDEIIFLPAQERKRRLYVNFNVKCTCLRCEDPTEFQTNFSSPICRSPRSRFCTMENADYDFSLWIPTHYLHSTHSQDGWTDYTCSVCSEVIPKEKIKEWELNFERRIYQVSSDLKKLSKLLRKTYNRKKMHPMHFLFFRGSWKLMEMLSSQINHTDFLDKRQYAAYYVPATSVHQIFKKFISTEIPLASPALRVTSLIKLAVLTEDIRTQGLSIDEIQNRLKDIYFTHETFTVAKIFRYLQSTSTGESIKTLDYLDTVEHHGLKMFEEAINDSVVHSCPTEGLKLLVAQIV